MITYKEWRMPGIGEKPRWVIVDETEKIIDKNPTKDELKTLKIFPKENYKISKKDNYKLSRAYLEQNYGKDFADWAIENIYKVPIAYLKAGCRNWKEYFDKNAKLAGFKDYNERQKLRSWENGYKIPKYINKECASYFSEKSEEYFRKYLLDYFENVKRTEKGSWDNGIDIYSSNPKQKFIGKYQLEQREYRIQIKAKTLYYELGYDPTGNYSVWKFPIRTNMVNIPDFWIFAGYKNREENNPEHIWIIHRDEIIYTKMITNLKLYERNTINIINNSKNLKKFEKFELR